MQIVAMSEQWYLHNAPRGRVEGGGTEPEREPTPGKGVPRKGSQLGHPAHQATPALFPGDWRRHAFLATRHPVRSAFFGRSISAFPLIFSLLQVNIMQIMRKEHWIPIATYHSANLLIISNVVSEIAGVRPNNAWNAACICAPDASRQAGPGRHYGGLAAGMPAQ